MPRANEAKTPNNDKTVKVINEVLRVWVIAVWLAEFRGVWPT